MSLASTPAASAAAAVAVSPLASALPGGAPIFGARELVRIFIEACVTTGGTYQAAVDGAIGQGLIPQDAQSPGSLALLDDRPGMVFSPAGHEGQVLLAVTERGPCLVWADRAHGPGVRLALQAALGERVSRGDRLEVEADRKLERSQTWRQQTQWLLRPAGAPTPLQIGLVNTVTDGLAAQVMRLQPMAATARFAPDGMPLR